MTQYVLITGVSSGIGYGALASFIKRKYHVFGSVRNQDDADRLKEEFGDHFTPLIFDVINNDQVEVARDKVYGVIGQSGLTCLVNNSGIAIGGPLMHQTMEEIKYHFDVNVIGLMRVTKAFLPLLGARDNHPIGPGKIINISSVAGRVAQPFVGAYVGSKHAVEGLSHSLRRELLMYGIDVVIVGPGAVKTPIWDKGIRMGKYHKTKYAKFLEQFAKFAKKGGENGLSIEFLGDQIVNISEQSNPKVRYAFVKNSITNWMIPKMLPHRIIDKIVKSRLKKYW